MAQVGRPAPVQVYFSSSAFTNFAGSFEADMANYYYINQTLDGFDGNGDMLKKIFKFSVDDNLYLATVMGGFKMYAADVTISPTQMSITYTFSDFFGAGDDDAVKNQYPGLPEMYFLQHNCGIEGVQYTPFFWSVQVQVQVSMSTNR